MNKRNIIIFILCIVLVYISYKSYKNSDMFENHNVENFQSILSGLKKKKKKENFSKNSKNSDNLDNLDNLDKLNNQTKSKKKTDSYIKNSLRKLKSKTSGTTFDDLLNETEFMDPERLSLESMQKDLANYSNSFKKEKFKNNSKSTAESFEKFKFYKEKFFEIFN